MAEVPTFLAFHGDEQKKYADQLSPNSSSLLFPADKLRGVTMVTMEGNVLFGAIEGLL